jgi:hypothetical protein
LIQNKELIMDEVAKTYWSTIRTLPVFIQKDGYGRGLDIWCVDWSSVFAGTTRQSACWVVGFDPVSMTWIDSPYNHMATDGKPANLPKEETHA